MVLRILLADDQVPTLEGVRVVLEAAEGISVVGEAHTAHELYAGVARTRPDMVLVDPEMAGFESEGAPFATLRGYGEAIAVAFSTSARRGDVEAALDAGATAYIVKTVHPLSLPAALRAIAERTVFHARTPRRGSKAAPAEEAGLSEPELKVLGSLAQGMSDQAIARDLRTSEQTVEYHLTNVFRKLGVPDRTAAVRYAHQYDMTSAGRT